jgi:hypothetical protein
MKSMCRGCVVVAMGLLFAYAAFAQEEKKPDPKFFVYLCFGQSNMEAGGRPDEQDEGTVDPRFQVLAATDMPRLGRKKGNWYVASPPLNRQENNLGPVDFFGRNMVANLPPDYRVGVINVSVAGAKIELWDKAANQAYLAGEAPGWMKNIVKSYDGDPYARLVEMGRAAQKDGVIKGILLHQGESNSNDQRWPEKVKKIYDDLVTDLGLDPAQTPLLAGELKGQEENGVCWRFNVDILPGLLYALPNSFVISSKGCEGLKDQFHFTTRGFRELGSRYAQQMLKIQGFEFQPHDRVGLLSATRPTTRLLPASSE